MPRRRFTLAVLGMAVAACRSTADDPRVRIAELEDRRVARPDAWESLLSHGGDEARARAARAVGRIRDPALASVLRRALHVEGDGRVKGEQLFALGQIGDAESLDVLLVHLGDEEPALRAAAAEAIGKLAVPRAAPNLVAHLVDPAPRVRGAALLALARLVGRRSDAAKQGGAPLDPEARTVFLQSIASLLDDPDESVRWKAAYAVGEIEVDGRLELLRKAANSNDATVRFFGVSGMARLATSKAAKTVGPGDLLPSLSDPNPFIAAAAATGLGRLEAAGSADTVSGLIKAADRSGAVADFHVRSAALSALAQLFRRGDTDASIFDAMNRRWSDPSLTVRGELYRAFTSTPSDRWDPETVKGYVERLDPRLGRHERVALLRGLGTASFERFGTRLLRDADDSDAYVASEALAALNAMAERIDAATAEGAAARARLLESARRHAAASDFAVAASALDLLKSVGAKDDLPLVEATFRRREMSGFEAAEARATAVHAAAALAGKEAVELLRRARGDDSPAVVAAAKEEWKKLGLPEEPAPTRALEGRPDAELDEGGPPSSVTLEPGVDFLSSAPNPRIVLHFGKGDVAIELLREEAPRHVKMMLARVRAGLCDGLPIHRVVTGFVVQGLDPRGDGWGTGGVFLRDEINRVPYLRGAVGMPNAGPDSGGCQLFVTLVPTPHLDGRYTVFGRVVAGMEVVDALDVGDACVKAEVVR